MDANGRFDLETAIEYAKMLSPVRPVLVRGGRAIRWTIELQAALAELLPGPMATGENLFSMQDARNLIRYGGMRPDRDWLQFDCALSYGLVRVPAHAGDAEGRGWSRQPLHPARRAPDVARTSRPAWAWAATRATPTCSSPMAAFPTASKVENSYVTLPELPGIGFEAKSDLYAVMRELAV